MRKGEIWTHRRYMLSDGDFSPKHLIIIGEHDDQFDLLCARLSSRPNGLPINPPCHNGNPRSGFYLGIPGGCLQKETWVIFDDVSYLGDCEWKYLEKANTSIDQSLFCALLRCLQQSEDIQNRQHRQISDMIQSIDCP